MHAHRTTSRRLRRGLLVLAPLAAGLAFGGSLLGSGQSAVAAPQHDTPAALRQYATYWQQLTSVLKPAPAALASMQDHRVYALPGGAIIGLHFDNMNLAKAKNLNWVVFGVPGVFTKADQQRVKRQYGAGFTHFHDLTADTHGGTPGAKGAWFVHVGARNFTSPFGNVRSGAIDTRFMPTPPQR